MTQPITIYEPNLASGSVEQTVADAVRNLGTTSDAVADFLRAAAVKGDQHDSCTCPLANLLIQLPGVDNVEVLDDLVYVWPSGNQELLPVSVDLPAPVAQFVARFDDGVYLDLVALAPQCTPACDDMTTRPEITGMDRVWHHDDCPAGIALQAAIDARQAADQSAVA